ncbi:hypothetical protein N9422_02625, partial [Candidatus Pelagibacter sp.]|nr:hypothetical protein [Candidatus Pelagibacter sp.]
MTKKYDLENDIKDILFNIKNSPFDEFIKIFWNDLDRLILDSLSLYKIPNSFTSRNDILFNSLENTKNTYLLFVYSLFFKKKYLPKSLLNYNQAVAWNNSLSIQKYAKIKNIKLQYTRNYDWFDKKKNISFNEKKFGIFVFSQIKKAISSFNSDKKLKKKLIYDLNLFYSWASHQLEFNSKLKMPKYFFSATMGSPLNRIMAINILKNGGKV